MKRKLSVAAMLMMASALAMAGVVDDAKILLQQGKAIESMELLETQLDQMVADVEFNYLLGIASLDAGKPGKAVFAFERVLAVNPSHVQARAELGRAMIALGEMEAAKKELVQVRATELPPHVSAKVDSLLELVERPASGAGGGSFSAYVEADVGYDTNINTATGASSVFIPVVGGNATLIGLATEQSSALLGLNGGIFAQKNVGDGVDIYGSLDGRGRYHPNVGNFATIGLTAGAGVRLTRGVNQFSVGLTKYVYWIDAQKNDDQISVYGQWQRQVTRQDILGVFGQYVRADHPIATFLDTNLYLAGGTWTHAFAMSGDPTLRMVAFAGDDRERGNDPAVGHHFYGAKASVDYSLRDNLKLFGSVAMQYGRYGGQNAFFLVTREDERHDISAGVSYQPTKAWTLTGQASYLRNDSNISIYDFDRKQAMLTLRHDFF